MPFFRLTLFASSPVLLLNNSKRPCFEWLILFFMPCIICGGRLNLPEAAYCCGCCGFRELGPSVALNVYLNCPGCPGLMVVTQAGRESPHIHPHAVYEARERKTASGSLLLVVAMALALGALGLGFSATGLPS